MEKKTRIQTEEVLCEHEAAAVRPYWKVAVSLLCSIAVTVLFIGAAAWGILFFMPFVIGWIISAIAHPIVTWLENRLRIRKKLGSVLIAIVVLGGVIGGIYAAVSRLAAETSALIKNAPQLYEQMEQMADDLSDDMAVVTNRLSPSVQNGLKEFFDETESKAGKIVSELSEPTVMAAGDFAKRLPAVLIGVIVSVLSAYFFTVEKEQILIWLKKVFPRPVTGRMTMVTDNLKYAVGGYFKAQFKIMGVVFAILLLGLGLLGVKYFVLIALLVAFLDFLPFFGTGTAMIPWAVFCVAGGQYKRAVVLVLLYVITQLSRHMLQPKLVGDSVGLHPIVTLILLYTGYRLGGMVGMILAVPVGLVAINMCKAGAFDYLIDDARILVEGLLRLRK